MYEQTLPGLSPFLAGLAATFARGSKSKRRSDRLWRVLRAQAELIRLPCVRPEDAERVCDVAVGNAMAVTLLDDIVDVDGDMPRFEVLAARYQEALFGDADDAAEAADAEARAVIDFAAALRTELQLLPRFTELRELLRFDLAQVFSAMRYHGLYARYRLTSAREYLDAHHDHSIMVMWIKTMELCGSPSFASSDLGAMRDAARLAQRVFAFTADATTWSTELSAGEAHPGVIKQAVVRGLLTWDDVDRLASHAPALSARVLDCGVLAAIAADVETGIEELVSACARVHSVDLRRWPARVSELLLFQHRFAGRIQEHVTYVLGRDALRLKRQHSPLSVPGRVFAFLSRNQAPTFGYFGMPIEQVIEIGMHIEL